MAHASYTVLILIVVFCAPILINILRAHRGKAVYLRPIAGLEAIDEAVGRATEMGQPVFYSPGLGGVDITTLASLAILKRVAKLAAQYNTRLIATTSSYLLYPMMEGIIREAYVEQGKGDMFSSDNVIFIQGQFPYAVGSVGIMHRERVAAAFFFGSFYAEALILAEGGNSIGAIQVAGTVSTLQVPFFIVACDYTVIGEEYFAASAYLSKDPTMTGSLAGQDIGKFVILSLIVLGTVFATIQAFTHSDYSWFLELIK